MRLPVDRRPAAALHRRRCPCCGRLRRSVCDAEGCSDGLVWCARQQEREKRLRCDWPLAAAASHHCSSINTTRERTVSMQHREQQGDNTTTHTRQLAPEEWERRRRRWKGKETDGDCDCLLRDEARAEQQELVLQLDTASVALLWSRCHRSSSSPNFARFCPP